ncbi:MAG: class I SAM-dependent methyltransferase [Thermomicrobiales bacterium]|nr:class I SAM-dependent methyltransferase [Thermomicrobiales bacterium]
MPEPDGIDTARFTFGVNWQRFLAVLDENRIDEAEKSLTSMLGVPSLRGKTFLDVGCGSGLFSLAAMRLGANRVHSFDYDAASVNCARELKARYFPNDNRWSVERGDVLDQGYLGRLGTWDVIYSWGVLHHTGDMWQALRNVADLAEPGSRAFISIYNDQGAKSRYWTRVKRLYNTGPAGRAVVLGAFVPMFAARRLVHDLVHLENPVASYRDYYKDRGMSRIHDWVDWLGGYPFEVARPEAIVSFYQEQQFELERMKTCGDGLGCNEFVLRKRA